MAIYQELLNYEIEKQSNIDANYSQKEKSYKARSKEFIKNGSINSVKKLNDGSIEYEINTANGLVICTINYQPGHIYTHYEGMWNYTQKQKRYAEVITDQFTDINRNKTINIYLCYRRSLLYKGAKYSKKSGTVHFLPDTAPLKFNSKRAHWANEYFESACKKARLKLDEEMNNEIEK